MDLSSTPPDYNPFEDPPAPEPAGPLPESTAGNAPPAATGVPWPVFGLVGIVAVLLAGWQLTHANRVPAPGAARPVPATGWRVISATYGSGAHVAEVTDRVVELLAATNAGFEAHPYSLGADPCPGWNKQLIIIYEAQGHRHLFTTGEGGRVSAAALREEAGP